MNTDSYIDTFGLTGGPEPRVSVVVPALNEEQSIGWVIEQIPSWVAEVILVDGLSVDGTELVASDVRPDLVVVHQRSRGRGAALRAGFAAATGDIVVMLDSDGSTDPREMGRYVDALLAGADFVTGSRNLTGGDSVDLSLPRQLGNLACLRAANLLFGSRFTDLCSGYCAFWTSDLERLKLTADGAEIELELVLSALKAGLRIVEVPCRELPRRRGGCDPAVRLDTRRVLKLLLRERLTKLSARETAAHEIMLIPTLVPAHDSDRWLPAGSDPRSWKEHEQANVMMRVLRALPAADLPLLPALSPADPELDAFLDRATCVSEDTHTGPLRDAYQL